MLRELSGTIKFSWPPFVHTVPLLSIMVKFPKIESHALACQITTIFKEESLLVVGSFMLAQNTNP